MSRIYFNCVPFDKGDVTLALESGVDGVIVPCEHLDQVAGLSRCPVWAAEDVATMALNVKADEEAVLERLHKGERVVLARQACQHYPQVRVEGFDGLLIDFARQQEANVLVRGIRTMTDFDYENQLAGMYRQLMPELEILFLPARSELSCVTSSLVREVALHGGDITPFVNHDIALAVQLKQQQAASSQR